FIAIGRKALIHEFLGQPDDRGLGVLYPFTPGIRIAKVFIAREHVLLRPALTLPNVALPVARIVAVGAVGIPFEKDVEQAGRIFPLLFREGFVGGAVGLFFALLGLPERSEWAKEQHGYEYHTQNSV